MVATRVLKNVVEASSDLVSKETKRLKKKPSNIKESADKAKQRRAAAVKALTRQQQRSRKLAMEEGLSVKKYKEKFSDSPPMKKLRELEKQNETIKEKEFSKGGVSTKKKVPVIAISVGMAEMPKGKKGPTKMAMGGMANGKKHMYLNNGGSVTDNAGLRALKASGPKGLEAYNKITKS